jgi:sugar/nucleoside kinase (ribokinase family)
MTESTQTAAVIALVRDLMFSSKISSTARALNISVKIVRDPARLADQSGNCLLVDLNQDGAISAAAQWRQAMGRTVIGFVSHVDATAISAARQAGIDQVMARSQFVNSLESILQKAASSQ